MYKNCKVAQNKLQEIDKAQCKVQHNQTKLLGLSDHIIPVIPGDC